MALLISLTLPLQGRQTARQKQKASRGIRSSSFLADMGLNVEDAQHGQLDTTLAQVPCQQVPAQILITKPMHQNQSIQEVSAFSSGLTAVAVSHHHLRSPPLPSCTFCCEHNTLCMHSVLIRMSVAGCGDWPDGAWKPPDAVELLDAAYSAGGKGGDSSAHQQSAQGCREGTVIQVAHPPGGHCLCIIL